MHLSQYREQRHAVVNVVVNILVTYNLSKCYLLESNFNAWNWLVSIPPTLNWEWKLYGSSGYWSVPWSTAWSFFFSSRFQVYQSVHVSGTAGSAIFSLNNEHNRILHSIWLPAKCVTLHSTNTTPTARNLLSALRWKRKHLLVPTCMAWQIHLRHVPLTARDTRLHFWVRREVSNNVRT
jgi:hypothetical protein